MHASEERKSMDADAEKYLLLMKEYCESHGAKLVLVSSLPEELDVCQAQQCVRLGAGKRGYL